MWLNWLGNASFKVSKFFMLQRILKMTNDVGGGVGCDRQRQI